jgi:hypothetical protein
VFPRDLNAARLHPTLEGLDPGRSDVGWNACGAKWAPARPRTTTQFPQTASVTLEILVIAAIRIAGSLPVLRWPLAGGVLAILVDLSDLLLRDALDLGGVGDYQSLDKWLDQVYLGTFLLVALRWDGRARWIAVALYVYRLAGFVLFELTDARPLLLVFPNVFELWFLVVAALSPARVAGWSGARLAVVLLALTAVKEVQEWALHGARLFDGISSLEFLDLVRRRLTGG